MWPENFSGLRVFAGRPAGFNAQACWLNFVGLPDLPPSQTAVVGVNGMNQMSPKDVNDC